jgi:choline-sulfatase
MVEPANLVLILAESHSARLLECAGDPFVHTPNLDRLAERGVRFTDTYCTSPICVPSRASFATGLYPHQGEYWCNSFPYHGDRQSWMRRLRDAGHDVTVIGKLHFRSEEDDNGFTREIDTMHVLEGVGELIGLLRCDGEEPVRQSLWEVYTSRAGVADTTPYQEYDHRITDHAVKWLRDHAGDSEKPWVLNVNFVSAHPPFEVPQRLLDLYPEDKLPLPWQFSPEERPRHPAIEHLRHVFGHSERLDEKVMRRVTACYFALLTHLDEQIGRILDELESTGLDRTTRIIYTADHGYNYGHQYIVGLFNLYDRSARVPLIVAGPGVPEGRVSGQIVSHVDIYPTVVEGAGEVLDSYDSGLPGISLWPAIEGRDVERLGFAEYHAAGSKAGAFILRDGNMKLIHHVGMPPQLFDLASDPDELHDLVAEGTAGGKLAELEAKLCGIVDPEDADARAKAAQRRRVGELGGKDEILRLRSGFSYSPPPGADWRKI